MSQPNQNAYTPAPLPQDPEKIEFFRNFGEGDGLLDKARAQALETFGLDEVMFREVQNEHKAGWNFDSSNYRYKPIPVPTVPGPIRLFEIIELPCPVCSVIFRRKLDLVEHCFRNRETIFHEVL